MASGQPHLLSRAFISAAVSGKDRSEVEKAVAELFSTDRVGLEYKVNALAYKLGDCLSGLTICIPSMSLHKSLGQLTVPAYPN